MQLLLFLGMAFGILMVVFLVGGFFLSKITGVSLLEMGNSAGWKRGDGNTLNTLRGLIVLQFLGLFLIPSLLFGYFSDPQPLKYLGLRKPSKEIYWVLAIAALLVSIPLVEYMGLLNRQIPVGQTTHKWVQSMEEDAARTIQYMLGGHTIGNLILNLIFVALFAGIGEELFFRGILQRLLIRSFKSPWTGIVLAAFFFSFFHFQFFGFIPRFLLGILLGAMYWYSGSLWVAILAHFFYDGLFIVLAYLQPRLIENPEASIFDNASSLAIMAAVSVVLTVFTVYLMKKNSTTHYDSMYAEDVEATVEKDPRL